MRIHLSRKKNILNVDVIDSQGESILKARLSPLPGEKVEVTGDGSTDFSVCFRKDIIPSWLKLEPDYETDAVYNPGRSGDGLFMHSVSPWYSCRNCGKYLGSATFENAGNICPGCGTRHTVRRKLATIDPEWYFAAGRNGMPVKVFYGDGHPSSVSDGNPFTHSIKSNNRPE